METSKKTFDVCGIGNGLLDVCINVSEAELRATGLKKGAMTLAEVSAQNALLQTFSGRESAMIGGGSIANSVVVLSQLGGKGALLTRTGKDRYGEAYRQDFKQLGMTLGDTEGRSGTTGTCVSLLTPDGERTMQTSLGVSAMLSPEDVDSSLVQRSSWLFVEGYLLINPGEGVAAVRQAVAIARSSGTLVALSFSDSWLVEGKGELLREIVEDCSLVFCNEDEARIFTGASSAEAAFRELSKDLKGVAVTAGARGAYLAWDAQESFAPGFACPAVDTTGAGDMFAGAVLYGICNNVALDRTLRGACWLSAQIVSQPGARLTGDVRARWEQADNAG